MTQGLGLFRARHGRAVLCCALLAAALTAIAGAQQVSPSLYAGLRWRMIGPFRGGRVLAVSGVAGEPNRYYFGAVGGGIWVTTDGGQVWRPVFDHAPIASIGALAIAPSDPNIIYAGTGEADMRSDITFGDGVYKSLDGGRTWKNMGLAATRHIGAMVVDPHDPNLVLVAALGRAYGPNPERGIFRSTDGGQSWRKVLYKDDNTGAIDLSVDPGNPHIVFATLWNARRPAWNQYPPTQGAGSGLYRSGDEGQTWTEITGHGLPAAPWGRAGVAVAGNDQGQRVYALIDAQAGSGLYRSDDGGTEWKRVSADARIDSRAWYFSGVYPDPNDPNVVYIANVALYRSTDGGEHFTAIKGAPGGDDYHALWIDPRDSRRMMLGSDQGAAISVDGGRSWSSWYNQPTAQFYHVITDNQFPYWVYGSQQDSGTAAVVSRSDYGQISFRDWHPIGGGESGYVAPDPLHPDIVYGGSTDGVVMRWNQVTGQSQNVSPWPGNDRYRFTWTFPIVFSPQDPHTLYAGSQFVLATQNGGQSWREISPDLTHYENSEPAPTEPRAAAYYNGGKGRGVVYTIAPSPAKAGEIWAGTDDGLIWLTEDGGQHWRNVTPAGLEAWSKISLIEASGQDAATAYAAVDRHRLDDFKPYIYRTHDFGRSWQEITAGIPDDAYVHAVRADPDGRGLLFAGTEKGVYVSFDDGGQWQALQLNLPVTSIRDLAIHDNDLIAATHGRSFWILDDITPLRQVAAAAAAPAYLFEPETAIRIRANEGQDTPLPPEEPRGQNPPAGAIIDYSFAQAPQGAVTLEIRDAAGRLVRRFSSQAAEPPPPATPRAVAGYWLPRSRPLPARAGMNRFVWNLRYPAPAALESDYAIYATPHHAVLAPEGALALPGRYELRLTADGQTTTRTLEVKLDPRVKIAESDLAQQVAFQQQIAAALEESAAAYHAIGALHQQLTALELRLSGHALAAARALDDQAAALAGSSASPYGSGATGAGFAALNGELAALSSVVDSADAAPTAQAREAFQAMRRQLDEVMAKWKILQKLRG